MPSSHIRTFNDPHSYQLAIRAATVEVLPITRGNFHAELIQIDLHRLRLESGRESLPRISHGSVKADRAAIQFLVDRGQPGIRCRGIEALPGDIIVRDSDAAHGRTSAPCHWGCISLTPTDLAAAGRAVADRELTPPLVTHVVRPPPALMARLLFLHERAAHIAKFAPDRFAYPEMTRSLEQALIRAVVRCLTEAEPIEIRASSSRHSVVIRRFEDFLAANRYEPVYLVELCAAIGVSERTLRICCREHLGMAPLHYLWLRRMHLAHRALMFADPASATVTEIATEHGFWELGRFSVEYRVLFGEPPSVSLHRSPSGRRVLPNRPFELADSEFA